MLLCLMFFLMVYNIPNVRSECSSEVHFKHNLNNGNVEVDLGDFCSQCAYSLFSTSTKDNNSIYDKNTEYEVSITLKAKNGVLSMEPSDIMMLCILSNNTNGTVSVIEELDEASQMNDMPGNQMARLEFENLTLVIDDNEILESNRSISKPTKSTKSNSKLTLGTKKKVKRQKEVEYNNTNITTSKNKSVIVHGDVNTKAPVIDIEKLTILTLQNASTTSLIEPNTTRQLNIPSMMNSATDRTQTPYETTTPGINENENVTNYDTPKNNYNNFASRTSSNLDEVITLNTNLDSVSESSTNIYTSRYTSSEQYDNDYNSSSTSNETFSSTQNNMEFNATYLLYIVKILLLIVFLLLLLGTMLFKIKLRRFISRLCPVRKTNVLVPLQGTFNVALHNE